MLACLNDSEWPWVWFMKEERAVELASVVFSRAL